MNKILDYLYIFSKLSVSFTLLLTILVLGYFFYIGFKSEEKQDDNKVEFINNLNQNSKQLLILSKKIETTDSSTDDIIKVLKGNMKEKE